MVRGSSFRKTNAILSLTLHLSGTTKVVETCNAAQWLKIPHTIEHSLRTVAMVAWKNLCTVAEMTTMAETVAETVATMASGIIQETVAME
ncbi:8652_t:CDS:2 [Acaulospora morrowiae]|uniref:8652_t:CDS:1 n=1 Tax=Acaulospora morrowiae TaxID=94023 RepID=A0A9N9A3X0_9GLOM|nr:8652_t:CDS:2 [Acaulospora morrowiae]